MASNFLAPTLGGGAAAFEQPVQQAPSALSAFADIASNVFSSGASERAPTQDELFGQAWLAYQDNLGLAYDRDNPQQLQGALIGFTQANPQFTSQAVGFGNAAGLELITHEARQVSFDQEIVGSEAYQAQRALYELTQPELTEEQVHQMAFTSVMTKQATDARITNSQTNETNNWLDIEDAYVARAVELNETFRTVVAAINEDQVITPEEAQAARELYRGQIGNLQRPAGVSTEDWDDFQTGYVTPLGTIFDGVLSLEGNLNEDMKGSLDQILAKAVSQGKLPPTLLIQFQAGTDGSYTALTNLLNNAMTGGNVGAQRFLENYRQMLGMSYDELLDWVTEFEFQDTSYLDRIDTTSFSDNPQVRRDSLLASRSIVSGPPEQAVVGLIETTERLNTLTSEVLQPSDFNKIFNRGFYEAINQVNEVNPVIGAELGRKTRDSISQQLATATVAMQNQAQASGFSLNPDGTITVIPERMSSSMQTMVETHWGGDWDAAFRDGGRIPSGGLAGQTLTEFRQYADLYRALGEGAKFISAANKAMEGLREAMPQVFPTDDPVIPDVSEISTGLGGMQGLIDRTESAGDYDALWQHSNQRGGAFSNVRVSEMTLGELREFSNLRGQYGQYVVNTNDGVLSTPMGRYQFVHTTLFEVAEQMGLSDDTVFTPAVQDAMFAHRVKWRLSLASTMEGKMEQLRNEWAGFSNVDDVSDAELVMAIEGFQRGTPIAESTLPPVGEGEDISRPPRRQIQEDAVDDVERPPRRVVAQYTTAEDTESEQSISNIDLIKESEGLRLDAYLPTPNDVWTIGYGHTKGVTRGMSITGEQAEKFLREDITWVEDVLNTAVTVPLNQNQYDALGSFVFNLGGTNFRNSTLLRKLNQGDYQGAADQLPRWNKQKGKVLRGLTIRRAEERRLFLEKE